MFLTILIGPFSGSNPAQDELDDMIDVRQFSLYSTIFAIYSIVCERYLLKYF